jgi:hypothetical protein
MIHHAFLTSDGSLEWTRFSNGLGITVNFAQEPEGVEGRTIPAFGYRMEEQFLPSAWL